MVRHVRAVSLWGTHLNLPRVRFKRYGGSKQAALREKLFARQLGDTIYFHRYPESDNLVVRQK